ncbi:MAG: class D beta-lactamase [Bacteroidales bacterium]|nr:class D beta-lactamase [Bacteroidales bacterium]
MLYLLLFFLISCDNINKNDPNHGKKLRQLNREQVSAFQLIIDSADVKGSILIYDPEKSLWLSNDFDWAAKGRLPASTFKIVNSIIAMETGVVEDDSTMFYWNGEKRRLPQWERDMSFRDAFHLSCVPCYQDVARRIGSERMNDYLAKFGYGNMKVDSSNIDVFWLQGDSEISQFGQIDFLYRFYSGELPIAERTHQLMKNMMVLEENEKYRISGKTGWSIRDGNNNGWFVGYLEKSGKVWFFATNVTPNEEFNMEMFPKIRKEITYTAFRRLGIL